MLLSCENIEIELIFESETILPSCADVGSWATNLMVASVVIFTALWWIWGKQITRHGSFITFATFMVTFILSTVSAILAAMGSSYCRVVFCLAALSHVPFVLATWMLLKKDIQNLKRLKSKLEGK